VTGLPAILPRKRLIFLSLQCIQMLTPTASPRQMILASRGVPPPGEERLEAPSSRALPCVPMMHRQLLPSCMPTYKSAAPRGPARVWRPLLLQALTPPTSDRLTRFPTTQRTPGGRVYAVTLILDLTLLNKSRYAPSRGWTPPSPSVVCRVPLVYLATCCEASTRWIPRPRRLHDDL
jgi:hypothetical protein